MAAAPVGNAAYLAQLGALALSLDGSVSGTVNVAVVRLVRQRLVQWIEDVRSVGGNEDLASAVEALVGRLGAALHAHATLAAEAKEIAGELAKLAGGAPPSPPKKTSRLAFWK
jgi:hypothetical protein